MTDAFTQLSTQVPDGFGALLAKSNEAAKPELEKQQAAEEEFAKQKGDVMVAKAKEIAKTKQAGIGGEMAVYKKYDKELMAPPPTIQYSSDTAEGMQSLAVLLPLAGAMMGGSGLLSGIGAMNAMSGVLEGHRQGNQDRIALEQKNFEQKMNEWKIHMEQVKGAFDRALQMAKLNASGAQAQLEAKLAELDAPLLLADVKRNGISNAAQRNLNTIDKMTTMIEQAQTRMYTSAANASLRYGPPMSEEGKRSAAEQYLLGNTRAITNLSRQQKAEIFDMIPQIAKEKGMSSEDIVAAQQRFIADSAEAKTLGQMTARTAAPAAEAQKFGEYAKQLSKEVPRGSFVPINELLQKTEASISDANLLSLRAAVNTFISEYSRAVTPVGSSTDFARKKAFDLLSTATSQEAFDRVVDVMNKEMEYAQEALRETKSKATGGSTVPAPNVPPDVEIKW